MIATLDLFFGLPLAFIVGVILLNSTTAPLDLIAWMQVAPLALITLGLVPAGVLVFLRQYRLAGVLQWLATLGGVLLGAALIYTALKAPPSDQSLLLGMAAHILTLAVLVTLPRWLRKLTED